MVLTCTKGAENLSLKLFAGVGGIEPPIKVLETFVIPLHHTPNAHTIPPDPILLKPLGFISATGRIAIS